MGASDYRQDLPPGLSTGVTASQLQQSYQRSAAQKEQADTWGAVAAAAAILIAVVAAHYIAEHRRKIARAADAAMISGLATGVRAARSVASKKDALITRVLAKADENPSRPD